MSKVRGTIVTKLVVVATLILFMVAQHPGVLSSAEAPKAATAVRHKPLKYFVAGHRIQMQTKVTDTQGVSLVRCYFRAAGQADYVFVRMKAAGKDTFTGILPSPAAETRGIEYLFLTVNGKNLVVKTQTFKTEWNDTSEIPAWQSASAEGTIAVSTELPQATQPAGFNDSTLTDVVESSVRFGYVAGIYSATQVAGSGSSGAAGGGTTSVGGTTGSAATASFSGTVAAATGLSTMFVAGASAAAVAAAAGVAVASGGGGGGDNDSVHSGCSQYAGAWAGSQIVTAEYDGRKEPPTSGAFQMTVGSDCTFTFNNNSWIGHVTGDTLSLNVSFPDGTATFSGVFTSTSSAKGTFIAVYPKSKTTFTSNWTATKQ